MAALLHYSRHPVAFLHRLVAHLVVAVVEEVAVVGVEVEVAVAVAVAEVGDSELADAQCDFALGFGGA